MLQFEGKINSSNVQFKPDCAPIARSLKHEGEDYRQKQEGRC